MSRKHKPDMPAIVKPYKVDLPTLKESAIEAMRLSREAATAMAEFNALALRYHQERDIRPGFSVDLWGDDPYAILPIAELAKFKG